MGALELKQTTNLPSSVEINLQPRSDRNDSDNHRIYNLVFPAVEDASDTIIDQDGSHKHHDEPLLGGVSTLDWLTTWRPLEIS